MKHKQTCSEPRMVPIPAWVLQEDKSYKELQGCASCGEIDHPGFVSDKKDEPAP